MRVTAAPLLATSRLELFPFAPADVDELHTVFIDAGVRRWLLDGARVPRAWVEAEIAASEARFAEGSAGLWSLRERLPAASARGRPASDAKPLARRPIIGFAGFRPFLDPPELQLVYGVLPSRWGLGLATEAASAVLFHAFERLGFSEARAATDLPNRASIAVLRRLGFQERQRTADGPAGTAFFLLTNEAWRARQPP